MRGRGNARGIAVGGMLTAGAAAFLYLSGLSEMASLSVLAIASLFVAAAVIECGLRWSVLIFVASGLLGLLIAPDKLNVILYLLLFGSYPIVKSVAETRTRSRAAEYIVKFAFCNLGAGLSVFAATRIAPDLGVLADLPGWAWIPLWIAGNAIFLLYDIALSRLIVWYMNRIRPKIGLK